MDEHERWVLEAAVDWKLPVRVITGPDAGQRLNRAHHGLDPEGVIEVLRGLLRQGAIALFRDGQGQHHQTEEALRAAVEQGDAGPSPPGSFFYGLTPSGGELWEAVAQPDWARYIDASYGIDPNDAEVICADPVRLNDYVSSKYQKCRPISGTVCRDQVKPWQATYWKMLPLGHRIRYSYDPDESSRPQGVGRYRLEQAVWYQEANEWFIR